MPKGAITGYIDVAQLTLYAFWIFFAGLIYYLHREDKREGYPMISDNPDAPAREGFPPMPAPKIFLLPHGGTQSAPRQEVARKVNAAPAYPWSGSPLVPLGNPMQDGVGAAAYADRAEEPELTFEGERRMVPLRVANIYSVHPDDPDPRGMEIVAADGVIVGAVTDLWIDRSEPHIRYVEVTLAAAAPPRTVLVPMLYVDRIERARGRLLVSAITSTDFLAIPPLKDRDQVTAREEDKITAYFAGGFRYATPDRQEPLL